MALLMDDSVYKTSAESFERVLRDVSRTPAGWCPVCAFGILVCLRDGSASLHALQREHHGLWDACIRQLVAKRSSDVESELRAQLRRNIDNCNNVHADHDRMLRLFGKDHITDPLMIFRVLLCLSLVGCLYGSNTTSDHQSRVLSRARDPRKRFHSSDDLWPRHPDQLFPYGSEQTVLALRSACLRWNDDGPWYILNAVVQIARPRVIGVITEPGLAPELILRCLQVVFHGTKYAVELLDETPSSEPNILTLADSPWLRSGAGRRVVAMFLRTLSVGPYARPDEIYRFLSYRPDSFRTAHQAAAKELAETGLPEWDSVAMALLSASPHMQEARNLVSDEQVVLHISQTPRAYEVLMTVWHCWRSLRSDKRCSAPNCTRTMLDDDSAGPSLQTCAKCRVVRYCGAACQRSDWRGGNHIPHKSVCGVLAVLQSIPGASTTPDEYVEAVRNTSISDSDLALIGRWAVSQSPYYMDLIRGVMAFPDLFSGEEVSYL